MKTYTYWQYTRLFLILTLFLTTMTAISVLAMPPHPDVRDRIERGEIVNPLAMAKISGIPDLMKVNAPSPRSSALTGTFRALCLLVDFSDNTQQASSAGFDSLIFVKQAGSVWDYFDEVSYSQVDFVTVNLPSSIGWQRAPQTYAYYTDDNYGLYSPYPNNSQKLCEDLVDLVDPFIDFSLYDNDGNGRVDVVMIVHAGRGAEYTGQSTDMWSHKWSISPRLKDGVQVSDYTVMPEYWSSPGDMTIGVFCHELGHVFGLADLYDTDGTSYGTGAYSLMSNGSWNGHNGDSPAHLDAWSKFQVGWLTPINITGNQTDVAIPAVETTPTVYRLWTNGSPGGEYFLVANRQQTGYDAALPGGGLAIWHIDDYAYINEHEWYPGHTDYGHYMVALEQADNLFELEKKIDLGDGGDFYPGTSDNRSFSPLSSPNSDAYSASSSFVSITNISDPAPVMSADFAVSFAADNDDDETDPPTLPQFALGQNYPNPFNPATRIDYTIDTAGEVKITIFNVLGQKVTRVVSGFHLPGTYSATWDGIDAENRKVPSGVYFYELISEDERAVKKMLLTK